MTNTKYINSDKMSYRLSQLLDVVMIAMTALMPIACFALLWQS